MERTTYTKTWHRDINTMAWSAYLGDMSEVPYLAAPGRAESADLRGLPPTFIDVGTLDAFYDEDVSLALRLGEAQVPVELVITPGAFHASEVIMPEAPTSRRILAARHSARQRLLEQTV